MASTTLVATGEASTDYMQPSLLSGLETASSAVTPAKKPTEDDLLSASSLETAISIAKLIDAESLADLDLLESLTPPQKLQVWEALSEAVQDRLVELRALADANNGKAESGTTADVSADDDAAAPAPPLSVGDHIVLHAKPQMKPAELKAIWKVVQINGSNARISTPGMTNRTYPMHWMALYPEDAIAIS
jgi:hypothetical protein